MAFGRTFKVAVEEMFVALFNNVWLLTGSSAMSNSTHLFMLRIKERLSRNKNVSLKSFKDEKGLQREKAFVSN